MSESDLIQENLELLNLKLTNSMSNLKCFLHNKGLYYVRVTCFHQERAYLSCTVQGKVLVCRDMTKDREPFAFYSCDDFPIGGLLHVSYGRWIGMDYFGHPVVQATKWASWEAIALTKYGVFFPARYFGTGGWLCWASDDKNSPSLVVARDGRRVEVELESI